MRTYGLGLITVLLSLAISAPTASALVASWYDTPTGSFGGVGCGTTDYLNTRLPRGAFAIRVAKPAVGAGFRDLETGAIAARLTDVEVDRSTRAPVVRITVTGSDDVCTRPGVYADFGWNTDDIAFRINYKTRERVYGPAECFNERVRPSKIIIACGDGNFFIKGIRWQRWGDHVAKGRGTAYANDCDPFCAAGHFQTYSIRLALSRPRYCASSGRYQFGRLDLRYPGAYPGGARAYHLGLRCGER